MPKVKQDLSRKKPKVSTAQFDNSVIIETITMTTVTERRIVRETIVADGASDASSGKSDVAPALPAKPNGAAAPAAAASEEAYDSQQKPPPIPPKESSPTQISGILKGGKLWKQDSISQVDFLDIYAEYSLKYKIICSSPMIKTIPPRRMKVAALSAPFASAPKTSMPSRRKMLPPPRRMRIKSMNLYP